MAIEVRFTPDGVSILAVAGESILALANRAGVTIPTGCMAGSCHACEVEIIAADGTATTCCACISSIPGDRGAITIGLYEDELW